MPVDSLLPRIVLLSFFAVALPLAHECIAATVEIQTIGVAVTVYNWKAQHCYKWMVPDAPARAFVETNGEIVLIAANASNWYMVGDNLDKIKPLCVSAYQSNQNADPLAFDGHGWVESTFSEDGTAVVALISNDWWPTDATPHDKRPPGCAVHAITCHFYSVNLATSHDDKNTFTLNSGNHVLATKTYSELNRLHPVLGFATATNMFRKGDFVYSFLGSRDKDRNKSGSCLFRARLPSSLSSWEYWNGTTFGTVASSDRLPGVVANCAPVYVPFPDPVELRSISFFPKCLCYIGLFEGARTKGGGKVESGFFITTSTNLTSWTVPQIALQRPQDGECRAILVYPSLLDPTSTDPNFSTITDHPYIYFTRFNRTGCDGTTDRDLVRVQIHLQLEG